MNFLKRIDELRHTKQYQKKFEVLEWLSKYVHYNNGYYINRNNLCEECHITFYDYKCVLAGSPLVPISVYNKVINYIKFAYYESISKFIFWRISSLKSKLMIEKLTLKHHPISNNGILQNQSRFDRISFKSWSSSVNNKRNICRDNKPIKIFKSGKLTKDVL